MRSFYFNVTATIFYLLSGINFLLSQPVAEKSANIEWQSIGNGIWKAVIGKPDQVNFLTVTSQLPATEALNKLGDAQFPAILSSSVFSFADNKTYLEFPLQQDEQLFGFGLNFKSVQQRGNIKTLHVDHFGGEDNGRTHAPVPFYISDKGYGILINSARYITVYAGSGLRKDCKDCPPEMDRNTQADWNAQPYSDVVEMVVPAAGTEIYLFAGKSPMEVVQRYNLFCGGGTLPPKWGLGFTERTPTLFSDTNVIKEADAFEAKGYPLDFIGLEPGWHSRSYPCTFEWDKKRYPDPQQFVQKMLSKKIRLNLWLNPYISKQSSIYNEIKPFTGSHTVWVGEVPDFTLPQARALYKKLFLEQHINIGVSGYKVDETDGYDSWVWPDVAKFPSGLTAEQMRQIYGLQFQKMTYDWFHEKNQRTYGLTRASNAGASFLPYVLYNDYYDHKDFITALCNSSFAGVLRTPEARSSKTSEEWLRRMQTVCFSPMAIINAWADGTKPWSFADVAPQVKDVMLLRMQLLPYFYNAFAQYHFEGKPPIRAMNLIAGFYAEQKTETTSLNSTDNPYNTAVRSDIKDQFMVGDYLLVAPLFTGDKKRKIILPKGKWYDFYTGNYAGNGEVIEIEPGLDKIPLFAKEGAMIPMIPPVLHTPGKEEMLPLTIRYYGTDAGKSYLYDDDGQTFNYEKGEYTSALLEVKKDKKGLLKGTVTVSDKKNFHYSNFKWVFMTK